MKSSLLPAPVPRQVSGGLESHRSHSNPRGPPDCSRVSGSALAIRFAISWARSRSQPPPIASVASAQPEIIAMRILRNARGRPYGSARLTSAKQRFHLHPSTPLCGTTRDGRFAVRCPAADCRGHRLARQWGLDDKPTGGARRRRIRGIFPVPRPNRVPQLSTPGAGHVRNDVSPGDTAGAVRPDTFIALAQEAMRTMGGSWEPTVSPCYPSFHRRVAPPTAQAMVSPACMTGRPIPCWRYGLVIPSPATGVIQ
jgi:hypothetical protein